ncbi:MAG TPA: Xaa-Pro peptidase family protein [Terriglobales bacterium]|nr:Xaa-Pro peptidase family protein [Terriglobales bacterium]
MNHTAMDPTAMDHIGRLRRLQASLAGHKLDSLLIANLPNVHYLCGFTGSAAALLVSVRGSVLFTDGRYRAQAKEEVKGANVNHVNIVIARKSPLVSAAEWLAALRRSSTPASLTPVSVGIEPESITASMRDRLASVLKGRARLRSAPPLVERARMVKDAAEILRIRRAVELGASLFRIARKKIRPGVSEVEVAAAMEYEARCAGAEGMSFPTILASGTRSAIVHGRASAARIPRRGFVVCDFGVILAHYCSDRTRTVHVGRPSGEARQLYEAVREAQQAAISAVRPGVTGAEVDGVARRVLRKWKLARYFTHSTGHGLGLEIHEAPRLAMGQTQTLEPGMVITIEPGAYVPGKWGVRIEDVVVVTSSGCEVLTPTDKELVIL